MSHLCIACKKFVNSRQEALLCDGCNKWQHRKCNSGVARDVYRNAVQTGKDIPWKCELCATSRDTVLPNFESTRNEDAMTSLGTVMELMMFSEASLPSSIMFEAPTVTEDPHDVPILDEPMEESIMDPRIHAETAEEDVPHVVTYELVEAGTKRARTKLVDSDGHTYNVQLRRANATYWQCTVR